MVEHKLYTYLQEYIMLYPEKTTTVTREELRLFVGQKYADGLDKQTCEVDFEYHFDKKEVFR